jgi:CRP-like cAMP-binding protein
MEQLKSYFQSVGFDEIESGEIAGYFKCLQLEKDEFFVKKGKTSTQLGFIEVGQFQYYSITSQGEERTTYISLENSFVASLLSYINEIPAIENIKAISNATLWVIDKQTVNDLQSKFPKFKDFYIRLIEYHVCCIDKSRLELISLTAEQRYEKILKEVPELLQKAPLQYIASMIGITPRHLSRLRKKYLQVSPF